MGMKFYQLILKFKNIIFISILVEYFMIFSILQADTSVSSKISGYYFAEPSTRAIQDDDFINPGFLWVEIGKKVWHEKISINGIVELSPNKILDCKIVGDNNNHIKLKCRIDTNKELEYYKAGGILNYVLKEIISEAA